MNGTNSIHPTGLKRKSLFLVQGKAYLTTLPYEAHRVVLDCDHSPLYVLSNYENQPLFCGLCLFREGFESEVPGRIHEFRTLAENGNPATTGQFMSHLNTVMGLLPPERKQEMKGYRLARGQFSRPAWRLFPVTSALWKLMGNQPPLAIVLIRGVGGFDEFQISKELDVSLLNVHIRMAKAIRTAMGYLPHGTN